MDIFSPIQNLADVVVYAWVGLARGSYLGDALNFFVYDSIKIGLLLLVINYVMAVNRYYFPMEKVRNILTKRRWYGLDYLMAAVLGVVTPFCSCSSIPLFIGFLSAGIPLGVTFSFLIASPLVNEASLLLFPALFGGRTTMIYNLIGIGVSVVGGYFIGWLKMEKYVESSLLKFSNRTQVILENEGEELCLMDRIKLWWGDGWEITRSVYPYVLLGVGIGAIIHGFVPQALVEEYLGTRSFWVVPLATLMGVPLYANSVSVIPIVEVMIGKGIPLGTALAFMTATVTLSIPEALILKKVMRWQLLVTFFGITITGIVLMGYLFNYLGQIK